VRWIDGTRTPAGRVLWLAVVGGMWASEWKRMKKERYDIDWPQGELFAIPPRDQPPVEVLLSAIRNALRTGSYMTGANLAFLELCDHLGVDEESLPVFDPAWSQRR
jgi:hypothetical protein